MNMVTLFRLLSRGIFGGDPRLEEEAKKIEDEDAKKRGAKDAVCKGFTRVMHLDDFYAISRWQREEGREIQLGQLNEIEVWQNGSQLRLAVRKDEWEVYVILEEITHYRLRRKVL